MLALLDGDPCRCPSISRRNDGPVFGWRSAFFLVGLPGLLLAAFAVKLPHRRVRARRRHARADALGYARLFGILANACDFGGAAMTFALGGFAVWMPSFFVRQWALASAKPALTGAITVVSGIWALLTGLAGRPRAALDQPPYFLVSGIGLLTGMPLAALKASTFEQTVALASPILPLPQHGPLNAIIASVTHLRGAHGLAANILVIHALGDAVSPWIGHWSTDTA